MKYKAKFSTIQKHFHTSYTMKIAEGQTFEDQPGLTPGVFVFIPFTDSRFFEPVKVRKFVVGVNEDQISNFEYQVNYENWTVTEIKDKEWIEQFKAHYPYSANEFSQEQLESFNPTELIAEFGSAKLEAVKWIKHHCNVGLKAAKELMDFTYTNINFI